MKGKLFFTYATGFYPQEHFYALCLLVNYLKLFSGIERVLSLKKHIIFAASDATHTTTNI